MSSNSFGGTQSSRNRTISGRVQKKTVHVSRNKARNLPASKQRELFLRLAAKARQTHGPTDTSAQATADILRIFGKGPYWFLKPEDEASGLSAGQKGNSLQQRATAFNAKHLAEFSYPGYAAFGRSRWVDKHGNQYRQNKDKTSKSESEFFIRLPRRNTNQNTRRQEPIVGKKLSLSYRGNETLIWNIGTVIFVDIRSNRKTGMLITRKGMPEPAQRGVV